MLTAAEFASARAAQRRTLLESATILRYAEVSDGAGGSITAWDRHATSAARVAPQLNQPQMAQFAARLGENVGWRVTLEAEKDVAVADRIRIGAAELARDFEVLGVLAPWTYETARVCICVERETVTILPPEELTGLDFSQAKNSMYLGAI